MELGSSGGRNPRGVAKWTVLLPPLAVYRLRGVGVNLAVSVLLTLAGYVPGLAHVIWVWDGMAPEAEQDTT